VSIELVFGNSLAAVELIDAAPNLRIDCFPVLRKPAVLFLLRFQQADQHFLDAGGAGGLKLLLDSGFQSSVMDFDVIAGSLRVGKYGLPAASERRATNTPIQADIKQFIMPSLICLCRGRTLVRP